MANSTHASTRFHFGLGTNSDYGASGVSCTAGMSF